MYNICILFYFSYLDLLLLQSFFFVTLFLEFVWIESNCMDIRAVECFFFLVEKKVFCYFTIPLQLLIKPSKREKTDNGLNIDRWEGERDYIAMIKGLKHIVKYQVNNISNKN